MKKPLVFLEVTPKKVTIAYVAKNSQFVADLRRKYTVSVLRNPTQKIVIAQKPGGPAVTEAAVKTVYNNVVVPMAPRVVIPLSLAVGVAASVGVGLAANAAANAIKKTYRPPPELSVVVKTKDPTLKDVLGPIPKPESIAVRRKFDRNYVWNEETTIVTTSFAPDIYPVEVIRGLNEDLFWALVSSYFDSLRNSRNGPGEFHQRHQRRYKNYLPSILYLLEMRGLIPSAAEVWSTTTYMYGMADFKDLPSGYWRCPLLKDFLGDNRPVFDDTYRTVVLALNEAANDVKFRAIDQHRSYQYQFARVSSVPRPDTLYDGPILWVQRRGPSATFVYFRILCRYLFYIDYIEAPSFLRFLSSEDMMTHFPDPTEGKLWLSMIRQVCPNCNLTDKAFTDIKFPVNATGGQANYLPYDVKLILLRMGAFKELDIHESTRSALNTPDV